jgi:predicted amidohydrolase
MCVTGYWHVRNLDRRSIAALAEAVPSGRSVETLARLAKRFWLAVGAGLIEQDEDDRLYNTYVVALPDGQVQSHRKLQAFENKCISSGERFTVFDTPWGVRAAILICWDNNLVENVRICALLGADLLIAPIRPADAPREARTRWGSSIAAYGGGAMKIRRRLKRNSEGRRVVNGLCAGYPPAQF